LWLRFLKERDAYERAKEQAQWDDSIKGLEDEVVQNRKTIKEKDNIIAEKDKTLEEERKARAELEAELRKYKQQ
jgi:hypothetical protein